jgi:thymidylate kinase
VVRIIEFCGAPGVGKSTVYNLITKQWNSTCAWIPAEQLLPRKKMDTEALNVAAEIFVKENQDYADACWKNIIHRKRRGPNGADLRFHAVSYWFGIFQKIGMLRQMHSSKWSLIDEGLIQRIDSALYRSTTPLEEKEEIDALLQIMTLPDAIIYLETDVWENVLRLRKRKKILLAHKNLEDEELAFQIKNYQGRWQYVFEKLKEKGIPILQINAKENNQKSVATIIAFLDKTSFYDTEIKKSSINF